MQALYLLALDPVAETLADPNSYGFRQGRCPADAIAQCFNILSCKVAPGWVLEGDIRSCFNQISHEWLLAHIPILPPSRATSGAVEAAGAARPRRRGVAHRPHVPVHRAAPVLPGRHCRRIQPVSGSLEPESDHAGRHRDLGRSGGTGWSAPTLCRGAEVDP
mgnify:CR=1 FL=1